MGAYSKFTEDRLATPGVVAQTFGFSDYNTLTSSFLRELSSRTQAKKGPDCLLIDIEEGGQTLWTTAALGHASVQMTRDSCQCFLGSQCGTTGAPTITSPSCEMLRAAGNQVETDRDGGTRKLGVAGNNGQKYELVMSCHSISFLPHARAVCFLARLRGHVPAGGMLFISALGKYSRLADDYQNPDEPLTTRYFPLGTSTCNTPLKHAKVCLYSERDLCNTLFESGWSVVRSSTSTENNVLATAIRI